MTAKELRNKFVLIEPCEDTITQFKAYYNITPEQLDEYIERVCEEQREICAYHANVRLDKDEMRQVDRNQIRNAPKPETK